MRRQPCRVVLLVVTGIACVLFAGAVRADWTFLIATDTADWYVDETQTRKRGTMAKVWSMQDFRAAQPLYDGEYQSVMMQAEIRCHSSEWRVFYFSYYSGRMGSGKPVYVHETAGPWKDVVADDYSQALYNTGCHPGQH